MMTELPFQLIKPIRGGIPLGDFYTKLENDPNYVCEAKMNGKRNLWAGGIMWSRSGLVWSRNSEVGDALKATVPDTVIDGELMAQAGVLWAFDLPNHPGIYEERRETLARLVEKINSPLVRLMPYVRWSDVGANGWEGVVFKKKGTRYRKGRTEGQTTSDWLKFRAEWL